MVCRRTSFIFIDDRSEKSDIEDETWGNVLAMRNVGKFGSFYSLVEYEESSNDSSTCTSEESEIEYGQNTSNKCSCGTSRDRDNIASLNQVDSKAFSGLAVDTKGACKIDDS